MRNIASNLVSGEGFALGPALFKPASTLSVKVMIADDHPLVCSAMTHVLHDALPQCTILTVGSLGALDASLADATDLNLLLLDLNMPGAKGFSSLLLVRGRRPEVPVILISSNDNSRIVRRARQFGAAAFLPKSAPLGLMTDAIRTVMNGGQWFPTRGADDNDGDARLAARLAQLTPQQMRVLMCMADGLLNKQIAHEMQLAENTIKVHVAAVLHKLGCASRIHAAVLVKALETEESSS